MQVQDDTDRKKVRDYFAQKRNQRQILTVLAANHERVLRLAQRRGTSYEDPIVDAGRSRDLRKKFKKLAMHYTRGSFLSEEEVVENMAEVLNKVRNKVFHGVKVYDDRDDIELLELVNPLLLEILRSCENLASKR
jgi:hypothetical protein